MVHYRDLQETIMKDVCIFIDVPYGIGGVFQFNQQILSALLTLPGDRYKLTVFYVEDAWTDLIPAPVEKVKVQYPNFLKSLFKVLFTIGTPNRIMRLLYSLTPLNQLNNSRFSLVIFPSQDLAGLFLSKHAVNVVYDLMHRYEKQFKESSSHGRGKFRDRLFGTMAKYSQLILVDSNVGKKQMIESYNAEPDNVEPLPYIAPAHIIEYKDEEHVQFFNKLNLPPAFIFYPAQYWPHKNHKILLEATNVLKKKIKDFHLVFTGPKRYVYDELYQYCVDNDLTNNVTFLDYAPNEVLGGFYLRARAMVMPTFYGPTNIPPLEAIALGCPVAVSNIYGMPEQLGDASLYFDNTNIDDVVGVLEKLWVDRALRKQLKQNSLMHHRNWNQRTFNTRVLDIVSRYAK